MIVIAIVASICKVLVLSQITRIRRGFRRFFRHYCLEVLNPRNPFQICEIRGTKFAELMALASGQ